MRMKKIILIAAVAIAAVACSKTFDTNLATEKAIGFGTWAETMTKGYTNTWTDGDAFKVYGAKFLTASAAATSVFTGETVSYDGSSWGYTDTKYWDLTAFKYAFYAFMPANQLETGAVDGTFTSKEITFAHPTANTEDILVASEYVRARNASGQLPTGVVPISFNHMASMVDVKVKKDASLGTATVKIKDATLVDIINKGTLKVTAYATDSPYAPTASWTPVTASKTNYVSTSATAAANLTVTGVTTYETSGAAGTTSPDANSLFENYVVLPQTLNAEQKLVISYSISADGATEANYDNVPVILNTFVNADNTTNAGSTIGEWVKGTHYTYYITIGANAITFNASVEDWATVNAYKYLVQ